MSKDIRLKKGLNINLQGEADKVYASIPQSQKFSIKPTDFHALTPKMVVKEGDRVKAGSCLFFDKYDERIRFSSPVSGEVTEIVRGAKRRIMEVKIVADAEVTYESFSIDVNSSREQIIKGLLDSGVWPFIRQSPSILLLTLRIIPRQFLFLLLILLL